MTASQLLTVLEQVKHQTIQAGIQMLRARRKVEPSILGIIEGPDDKPALAMVPILDLSQRFTVLRQGVREAKLLGFVIMFDGVVKGLDGAHDALLVVACTAMTAHASAVTYRHTVDGLRVSDPVDAPDEIAAEYQKVFDVHPQQTVA